MRYGSTTSSMVSTGSLIVAAMVGADRSPAMVLGDRGQELAVQRVQPRSSMSSRSSADPAASAVAVAVVVSPNPGVVTHPFQQPVRDPVCLDCDGR